MLATPGVTLLHVPPPTPSLNEVLLPLQILVVPLIPVGCVFTFTV